MLETSTPAIAPRSRKAAISYRTLMDRACESIGLFRPAVDGLPVEKRGVAHTEMFFVYALSTSFEPRQILESGRARGQSTLVLSRCFPESRIVSVEMDESSLDAKFALERLSSLKNVKLLFGDAREVLPAAMQPGDVVLIDGPKEFRAIKLAINLLRTGKPRLIFIHDFYAGSAERRFLERHMPDAIFSDAPDFLRAFAWLDGKDGSAPRRWNAFACIAGGQRRNYFLLSILLWLSRSAARLSEKLRLRRNKFPARHADTEGSAGTFPRHVARPMNCHAIGDAVRPRYHTPPGVASGNSRVGRIASRWLRIEVLIATILIACSLLQIGRMIGAMATTSLTTDEFGSICAYSGNGPVRVITDYRAAKNHIFFSLLNSVLPGRASMNPARARALSFAAVSAFALLLVTYAVYRGQLYEGALLLILWTFAPENLQLCLEARGYGFLALAALVASAGVIEYLHTSRPWWIYSAAVAVALGTYTIPGFLFFGGPLLFLTWLVRRDQCTFVTGLAAGAAIIVLYSPVAPELLKVFRNYGDLYQTDFDHAESIVRVMRTYLLPLPAGIVLGSTILLGIAPFGARWKTPRSAGARVVMGASLIFLALMLYLRSAQIRMANFDVVPFALGGIFTIGALVRARPIALRIAIASVFSLVVIWRVAPSLREFDFQPHEDWSLAGRIGDLAFAPGTGIDFQRFAKYLEDTLANPKERSRAFNRREYLAGRLVVADASNKWSTGRQFSRPPSELHNAQIVLPGATRDIVFTFQIPITHPWTSCPPALNDRDSRTGIPLGRKPLVLKQEDLHGVRAIVLLASHEISRKNLVLTVSDATRGDALERNCLVAGNAIIVPLDERDRTSGHLILSISSQEAELSLVEAWQTSDRPAMPSPSNAERPAGSAGNLH
jgi:hypothetical protein